MQETVTLPSYPLMCPAHPRHLHTLLNHANSQSTQQPGCGERRGWGKDTQLSLLSSTGARNCSALPTTAASLVGTISPWLPCLVLTKRIPPTRDIPASPGKHGLLPISDCQGLSHPQTFKMTLCVTHTDLQEGGRVVPGTNATGATSPANLFKMKYLFLLIAKYWF